MPSRNDGANEVNNMMQNGVTRRTILRGLGDLQACLELQVQGAQLGHLLAEHGQAA